MAQIVTVYSNRGGTGKSQVTASLAALASRMGLRVGLMDIALHSPTQHLLFGLQLSSQSPCLVSYLGGSDQIEDTTYDITDGAAAERKGVLLLVPSVGGERDAVDLLTRGYDLGLIADACFRLVGRLELDVLFLDTHPGVSSESMLAVALADTTVLVVRPDAARAGQPAMPAPSIRLKRGRRLLVLNMVPTDCDERELRQRLRRMLGVEPAAVIPYDDELSGFRDLAPGNDVHRPSMLDHLSKVVETLVTADRAVAASLPGSWPGNGAR